MQGGKGTCLHSDSRANRTPWATHAGVSVGCSEVARHIRGGENGDWTASSGPRRAAARPGVHVEDPLWDLRAPQRNLGKAGVIHVPFVLFLLCSLPSRLPQLSGSHRTPRDSGQAPGHTEPGQPQGARVQRGRGSGSHGGVRGVRSMWCCVTWAGRSGIRCRHLP